MDETQHTELIGFLKRIPSVKGHIGSGTNEEGFWWVKLQIDIDNEYAWFAIQELACVINYISINERLPTRFYPVSPAPYLNGGPKEFLSWVIENTDAEFSSKLLMDWLESRLPNPVDDLSQWNMEE